MKKKKLVDKKSKAITGTMTFTYSGLEGNEVATIEELEKQRDLASVRFTYALEQEHYWRRMAQARSDAFAVANRRYMQKKHGLTDSDIRDDAQTKQVWTYAK